MTSAYFFMGRNIQYANCLWFTWQPNI